MSLVPHLAASPVVRQQVALGPWHLSSGFRSDKSFPVLLLCLRIWCAAMGIDLSESGLVPVWAFGSCKMRPWASLRAFCI